MLNRSLVALLCLVGCKAADVTFVQADGADGGNGDASGDDAELLPGMQHTCFGSSFLTMCLQTPPSAPLTISSPTAIDTTSSPMCAPVVSGGNYCVLAATTISINGALRAVGHRPLVLIASESITTTALIDVGSHRNQGSEVGAGADPASCVPGTVPPTSNAGGGGAGGSFAGVGGAGGGARETATGGGMPGPAVVAINELRGGCPGQDGSGGAVGFKGHGGGAVYLIAESQINLQIGINAGGEGGAGGSVGAGGAGGGAGGMIGLDAPVITVVGLLLANGGAGSAGSDPTGSGVPGADSTAISAAIGGNGGAAIDGGTGGNGSAGDSFGPGRGGRTGFAMNAGGGGGGGGAGVIKAPATASLGTNVSPAPIH